MKGTEQFKLTIKAYLDERAKNDELFASSYTKENKNLDDCITFILNQARAIADEGGCGMTDDEVYSLVGPSPTVNETCGSYLTTMSVASEGIAYWTINAFSMEDTDAMSVAWMVAFTQGYGGFLYYETDRDDMIGARPVVFLKSSIQITGGDGTKSNPYIIQ